MSIIPPAFCLPTLLCIGALASLSVLSSPASAVVVTVNGNQYDLDVFDGPYLGNESLFSSIAPGEMPWWGNEAMAIDFASQVFDQLLGGTTPGNSPLFAYEVVGSDVNGWSSDILSPNSLYLSRLAPDKVSSMLLVCLVLYQFSEQLQLFRGAAAFVVASRQ